MNHTRPFLKWAGNKYSSLRHILKVLPQAKRLIEPFAGSGAVFINTNYNRYFIAEDNPDLIMLYQHLQQEGGAFITYCKSYFLSTHNNAERYYHFREEFNQCTDSRQRAALFLYLNHHGYNGLCRYNKSGKYNVPFGSHANIPFPEIRMRFFYQKSTLVEFKRCDFKETFAVAKKGDIIYCDPPYVPLEQLSNFSSYTNKGFSEADHITLAELAIKSAKRGITTVISNHDTAFTRHHYRTADINSFPVNRYISRNLKSRLPVQELLAVFR